MESKQAMCRGYNFHPPRKCENVWEPKIQWSTKIAGTLLKQVSRVTTVISHSFVCACVMPVAAQEWEEACEAIEENDVEKLKELIRKNKRLVQESGEEGDTLLHNAALHSSSKVVKFLISKGAHVDAKDKYGGTPIHDAISGGNVEIVRTLASNGADMEVKDGYGWTPLWLAAW